MNNINLLQTHYERFQQNSLLINTEKIKKMVGYAILVTDDPSYWEESMKENPIDQSFRIDEGKELKGKLSWNPKASKGSIITRENPLELGRGI